MRTVKLELFKRRGEWGAAPADAIREGNNSFDPFWHGIGIFHDVFEHHFEYNDPHFRGEYSQNIAGEIAATGATLYFNHKLNLSTRHGMASGWKAITFMGLFTQTGEMMADTITRGVVRFGKELLTNLEDQPLTDYDTIEDLAQFHLTTLNTIEFDEIKSILFSDGDPDERRRISAIYRKSITLEKLQTLYRWGYSQAQKEAPDTPENHATLAYFIKLWEVATRVYPANLLAQSYKYIEFTVNPGPQLTWDAKFIMHDGVSIPYTEVIDLNSPKFARLSAQITDTLRREEELRRQQCTKCRSSQGC